MLDAVIASDRSLAGERGNPANNSYIDLML